MAGSEAPFSTYKIFKILGLFIPIGIILRPAILQSRHSRPRSVAPEPDLTGCVDEYAFTRGIEETAGVIP